MKIISKRSIEAEKQAMKYPQRLKSSHVLKVAALQFSVPKDHAHDVNDDEFQ